MAAAICACNYSNQYSTYCTFYARTELQITKQPQSNTRIKYGQYISLSVSATGAENLVYLWEKDGEDLTGRGDHYIGTNTPTLTISEFLIGDQGTYICVIKNCNSSIESEEADLTLGMFMSIIYIKNYIYSNGYCRATDDRPS